MKRLFIVLLVVGSPLVSSAQTYDDVTVGMRCWQNMSGDLECEYKVGQSLHFGIAGVGEPDASIYFYASSSKGDYFAVVGLSHKCVVVKPGLKAKEPRRIDLAFVSPRNGKVYHTWESCQAASW
ncbi:MAG: hypothetical protein HYX72_09245 [Acidobacteria bacterium]|nr:hypothetical protein [Acidobacteriota bacterium]